MALRRKVNARGVSTPAHRGSGARRTFVVFALVAGLLWLAVPTATSAASNAKTPAMRECGAIVQLLSGSLVIDGISNPLLGTLIINLTGPLDDLVQCAQVALKTEAKRTGCPNAQVPGLRLRPRVAAKAVRCLINEERRRRGISELEARSELRNAAKDHTHQMLSNSCFSHQCAGEPDLVARTTKAMYLPCQCTWTVAENLAWGLGAQSTPAAIIDAWMHSPGHRDTLLLERLKDVGVAVGDGRPGNRTARGATYTADFGVKR